jgi:hypothetical protein
VIRYNFAPDELAYVVEALQWFEERCDVSDMQAATRMKLQVNLAAYSRQKRGLSHEEYRDTVALEESIDRDYESA